MLYKTSNNKKTGHSAEPDNVYDIVNSYIDKETATFLLC